MFSGGVLFFFKQMFFSATLIGVSILIITLGGDSRSNLSCQFYRIISVISTILLYHVCGRWFTDGWLGHGCFVLVVKCVSFFCPGLVLYYYYLFRIILHYNDGYIGSMKTVVVVIC